MEKQSKNNRPTSQRGNPTSSYKQGQSKSYGASSTQRTDKKPAYKAASSRPAFEERAPRAFSAKPSSNKFADKSASSRPAFEERTPRAFSAKPSSNKFAERPLHTAPQAAASTEPEKEPREDIIAGRNPVIELLKSEISVDCIYMQKTESKSGAILKIISLARDKGLVIKEVTKEKLDTLSDGANHQGVVAVAAAYPYKTLEDIIAIAGDEKLFVIIADEIEDPHNLGAIIRTADAVGAHGVIIPKRRGAGLTSSVMRASAGAAQHVAVAKVPNLMQVVDKLKEMGVWVYAADMEGTSWCTVDYSGPVALVVGSEGHGVSRLIKERSDMVISLPMSGKVNSLNVSVAAGVVLYEISRQRLGLIPKR